MKRILALLLAAVTAVTLAACIPDVLLNGDTQKVELSRGEIAGDVYKNEFLGFEFHKPGTWVYSTDEEIAAAMNVAADSLLGDNFKDVLENTTVIYDMMVVDAVTMSNISVVYENLKKSFASNITEEQYVEALKQQMARLTEMTVEFSDELVKVKLGGSEFTKCVCTTTAYGVSMTQIYYLRNVDGYMASVVVTLTSGYTDTDVEAMFK